MTVPVELDRSFHHDGHRLVYDSFGEGDEVVVYLHGLLLDSELNRGIADALATEGRRVVLLDLLGHGRSDQPTHASHYRIDAYAAQIVALLDHLDVGAAVVGGVSLGANASLFAASQHPDRIRGMVLEMPVLEWAVPAAALTFAPLLLAAHYARRPMAALARVAGHLPSTPIGPLNSVLRSAAADPDVIAAVLHGILVGPVAPTVEQRQAIDAPTLILGHGRDLIHPFSDAQNLARQLPAATLVRARSQLELRATPGRLIGIIADFVDATFAAEPASSSATA